MKQLESAARNQNLSKKEIEIIIADCGEYEAGYQAGDNDDWEV